MKILQVGPIPPEVGGKTVGGVATHVWDLSTHLARRGYEVAILADNFHNPTEIPIIKEGVEIYGFSKYLILRHLPSVLLNLPIICKLKKHFKGLIGITGIITNFCYYKYALHHFRPDVIHVHHLESRFPFAYFASKGVIPIVTTVHSVHSVKFSPPVQSQKYRKLIADNLKLSQNLIFVSKFVKFEFEQYTGTFKGKSWVIYYPMDTTKFYPINKEDARVKLNLSLDVPIILFVGSLTKRKGEYVLLDAAKMLKEKEVNLKVIIIGDGSESSGVQQYVIENECTDIVKLIKNAYHSELLLWYNAADLFVMPSFSESWGLVYIEAMLCGTPVIGIKGIANEPIPSEEYGFLVPPGNAESLAKAVHMGLNNNWNRQKITAYGKSFAWDKNIYKFEEVYKEMLSNA
jgi:glycosyltransferase involved in cell wall biosynthesis